VGERGKNNGFVLAVALQQRKWRLQTGKGLRQRIPDAAAAALMREALVPHFREKRYARGLAAALSAIDRKAAGHAAAPTQTASYASGGTTYASPSYPTAESSGSAGFDACGIFFGICAVAIFIGVLLSGARANGRSGGFWSASGNNPHHHHHDDPSWIPSHHSGVDSFPHVDPSPPADQSWMHSPPPVDTTPPPSSGGSMDGGGGASGGW
jgi:uncharacterized membrane protein YgcG